MATTCACMATASRTSKTVYKVTHSSNTFVHDQVNVLTCLLVARQLQHDTV